MHAQAFQQEIAWMRSQAQSGEFLELAMFMGGAGHSMQRMAATTALEQQGLCQQLLQSVPKAT